MNVILGLVIFGILGGIIARCRFRSFLTGFFLGLTTGLLGVIGAIIGNTKAKAILWTGRLVFFVFLICANTYIFTYAANQYDRTMFYLMIIFLPITDIIFPFVLLFKGEPEAIIYLVLGATCLALFAWMSSRLSKSVGELE